MNMLEWARREVEIACKKEAPDNQGEWDYGIACYRSALKAYEAMIEGEHSGLSWSITREILIRLMKGLPLTPIEDVPESWDDSIAPPDEKGKLFQCIRKTSLFKDIGEDGKASFTDVDRVVVEEGNTGTRWYSGTAARIVNEKFPITFPYCPSEKPYVVHAYEYLTDRKNGDFDTVWYMRVTDPDGVDHDISRYFADDDAGWREIDRDEFERRYALHMSRKRREKKYGIKKD